MAIRVPRSVRPLAALVALGAALALVPTVATATPPANPGAPLAANTASKPTIDSVQKQLGQLVVANTQLVEKYNRARITVAKAETAAGAAHDRAVAARAAYLSASDAFTRVVQAQYESGGMSTGGALLASNSDTNYLARLDTMKLLSSHDANVVTAVATARTKANAAAAAADTALATARAQRDALGTQKTKVANQITKYRNLLATLNSAARAAFLRAQNPSVSASDVKTIAVNAPTGAAQRAVQYALAQVGKPYVFGAAGPGSFDCSGLTMMAWQAGGVSLPHSAADQYNYGHHVSRNQLTPGDLIFFYQPIGHVTIYIGNGLMVSAPTEGEPVMVVPLASFNSDYVGATHLG